MFSPDSLNQAQRKAVTHGEGALLVLAGPGSGKTFTITRRIAYLIEARGVPPEEILVITFTRDAALSMQERFRAQCPRPLPVNFGTFHSVFYHILRESRSLESFRLLSESQKKNLLLPIMKQLISREEGQRQPLSLSGDAAAMLAAIGYYKNTGDEAAAGKKLDIQWRPHFAQIREWYGNQCKSFGGMDFDDMVFECRRLLGEDVGLRQRWQNRFTHILMDEFQDINPMQYAVVRLLAKPPYNLFAVGDDDQAIYGFRGADPRCLMQFVEDYHAPRILLNLNYRSNADIVEASSRMISENRNRFPKQLQALPGRQREPGRRVRLLEFPGPEEQYGYLVRQVREWQSGEEGGDAAVLFRTNARMQEAAVRLKKAGIEYRMREKAVSIYEHFVVKDIMAYLKIAAGDCRRELFLQVMDKPARYIGREAVGGAETVDWDALADFYRRQDGPYGQKALQALMRWRAQSGRVKSMPLGLAVQYICRVVGYGDYLGQYSGGDGERLSQWQSLLEWLKEDAKNYNSAGEWEKSQKAYTESLQGKDVVRGRGLPGEVPGKAVQLMTVHGSKGLEFDRVWIPDCNEKVFPHGSMPEEAVCEEERRIFYVAMTRAKEKLELLCLTGTRERPRLPSRFLKPLSQYYSSTSSSNSQLSRYSSKASATFSYSSSSSINPSSGSSLGSSGFSL